MPETIDPPAGTVYLVGGGPGAPGLITVRGAELLARADVVLYDYLANPALLDYARSDAEQICLGRHGRDRLLTQTEINRLLIEHARAGRRVVRLKSGDPAVFARGSEEVAALESAGIPFEIVPGITAALAAGSHAGIPLTDRQRASAVALVTGHEQPDKECPPLDYPALARFPGTLVFYMGVTTAPAWTAGLIAAGLNAATPAAIIRRCSWPDQVTIRCTLGTLADELARRKMRPPVVCVVGSVVELATEDNWFTRRPLFGQRVLVARPKRQAAALAGLLREHGADVVYQPAIAIEPPHDWGPVDQALGRLREFAWIVFSSANGVQMFLDRLEASGRDVRALGDTRIAAIGPGTADELARYRLQADLLPESYRAEALADALCGTWQPSREAGPRMLLVRASRGREVLAERLSAAGAMVEQVVAYQSLDVTELNDEAARHLAEGKIDWVVVTSSAIARSLAALCGEQLKGCQIASISPITTATLAELGLSATVEARCYTMAGVVEAMVTQAPTR